MEGTRQFQLNAPAVICQVMEGDAVLVHFESGLYYSARGTGADVCTLLMAGVTFQEVVDTLARQHNRASGLIEPEVRSFVERLVQERLFVSATTAAAVAASISIASTAYQTPILEVFDDMADQLLLDKIEDETREAWTNS